VATLKRAGKGFGVSLGILVAGIVSVFYAVLAIVAVETLIKYIGIATNGLMFYVVLFVTVFFTNVGTYAFTTEVPLHLTRTKNTAVQILAHILSSTTATFVKTLELSREPVLEIFPIDDVLVAVFVVTIPFVIIVYTVTRRSKEKKAAHAQS